MLCLVMKSTPLEKNLRQILNRYLKFVASVILIKQKQTLVSLNENADRENSPLRFLEDKSHDSYISEEEFTYDT